MATVQVPSSFRFLFEEGHIRYRVAYGGRGSGKSWAFAQALLIKACQQPLRVLCAREIQLSIRDSVKRLLDDLINAMGLHWFYQSFDTEIRGKNGSLFTFTGLKGNADSVRSKEGVDICWVEEAATVSQNSLNTLIPTIRKPGSELWMTYNPRFATDPVDAMFRGGEPPPGTLLHRVNWDANPFFPEVLLRDLEWDRQRDPDKYAHIWLGEYQRNSEARVFHNWTVKRFDTPSNARFYFGADWGFSVDPTVLVRCYIDGKTLYVDREAYQVGCEIRNTPALFDKIPGSRQWRITADSARPETISEMKHYGFNIASAAKGAGSLEDGIEFLKNYDIIVHPDCRHTIDELTMYSYKVDKLTGEVLPQLEDKKNHVIDALRYAVEATRRTQARYIPANIMGR